MRLRSFVSNVFAGVAVILVEPLTAAASDAQIVATPVTLNGVINADSDDTLAFTPDGDTVFFDRSEGSHKTVMVSHRIAGCWAQAEVASFSGAWFDQNPVVAPDGSYLLFNSDRPVRAGGDALRQSYFPGGPGPGSNIWRVNRVGPGWGEPVWLGPAINCDVFIDFASIAGNGALYFMRWDAPAHVTQFWRSAYTRDAYQPPERVILGNPVTTLHDPAVAPDESFIVFDSDRVQGGLGRLCIAFRDGDHWSAPMDFGDALNANKPWGAHLAPDGRTVYVTGRSGISQISLAPWLEAHSRR